jgi:hypothetical protein
MVPIPADLQWVLEDEMAVVPKSLFNRLPGWRGSLGSALLSGGKNAS